jgi:DNA-binding IclR family transcriptional regulator
LTTRRAEPDTSLKIRNTVPFFGTAARGAVATSIQRVGLLVEALAQTRTGRIRDLAARLRISKSSVHRLLRALAAIGWVEKRVGTADYVLTAKLVQLGERVANHFSFREEALPFLSRLAKESGETVHLGVLADGEVVYLERIDSSHQLGVNTQIGHRSPLWCTGIGKAILAYLGKEDLRALLSRLSLKAFTKRTITDAGELQRHLTTIRRRGYAIDNQEWCTGLISVAAPLRDGSGKVVAAVSVVGPSFRMRPRVHEYGKRLLAVTHSLSARLGFEAGKANSRPAAVRDLRNTG